MKVCTAELTDGSRTSLNHNSYLKILNGVHLFSLDRVMTAALNRYLYFLWTDDVGSIDVL